MEYEYNELITNEKGEAFAFIMDEEGDTINLKFHNDECVTIDFKNMSYGVLDESNLRLMIYLINEATKYFESEEFDLICFKDVK